MCNVKPHVKQDIDYYYYTSSSQVYVQCKTTYQLRYRLLYTIITSVCIMENHISTKIYIIIIHHHHKCMYNVEPHINQDIDYYYTPSSQVHVWWKLHINQDIDYYSLHHYHKCMYNVKPYIKQYIDYYTPLSQMHVWCKTTYQPRYRLL